MANTNMVIAGDYAGRKVKIRFNKLYFCRPFYAPVLVDATTVSDYEVMDQDVRKSGSSIFFRGLAGKLLLGNLGMLAGALSAGSKSATTVSITFKNGDKSLVELGKKQYRLLLKKLYK